LAALAACSAQKAAKPGVVAVLGPQAINCAVQRRECSKEQLRTDGTVGCAQYANTVYFNSTICTADAVETFQQACDRSFCKRETANPHANYDYLECLTKGGRASELPNNGLCQLLPGGSLRASLLYLRAGHQCVVDESGQFCASFAPYPVGDSPPCLDMSERTAVDQLSVPSDARDAHLWIEQVVLGSDFCNMPPAPTQSALTYSLPPAPIGSVSAAGLSVTMSATQGSARIVTSCANGSCQPSSLSSLQAKLADTNILGVSLTNTSLRSRGTSPVVMVDDPDGPKPGFAPGTLSFVLEGTVAGIASRYVIGNDTSVTLDATSSHLNLRGAFRFQDVTSQGRPLPVTAFISLDGAPSTGTTASCTNATSLARLFGFETLGDWTSGQASLSLVTSPVTQGCAALAVAGQGYMTVEGRTFANSKVAVQPAVSVDLFVPSSQPNPYWTGALQLFLTCPSRAVYNQYVGQVELTGKPQNQYSTLRYALPSGLADALRKAADDCRFSLALNVNPTGRTWLLDNLRLTP
jgi:hypothetical protein